MKKGFTIVELLASLVVMALIIIISIPAYNGISNSIKEQTYNSKLSMIEKSTLAYINKYHKDKVFNGEKQDVCYQIIYLINKNVISPDNKTNDGITDPINGGDLKGYLKATYNEEDYEVQIEYVTESTFESASCQGGKY